MNLPIYKIPLFGPAQMVEWDLPVIFMPRRPGDPRPIDSLARAIGGESVAELDAICKPAADVPVDAQPPARVSIGKAFSERWYVLEGWSVSRRAWVYREDRRPSAEIAALAFVADWDEREYQDAAAEIEFRKSRGER
ncbi:MAG TPA: hypothetical protein VFG76_06770 [Candidatus Polarisedimenticolia bacterium]|nr:hypothetical protein [Candidatus Polarisedimenticolia bacterium]